MVLDRTDGLLYYFVKIYNMEKAMNMRSKQFLINREEEPSGWKFFLILRAAQGSIGVLRMKIIGLVVRSGSGPLHSSLLWS